MHQLIKNCDYTREELYELVQISSFEGQKHNSKEIFFKTLKKLAEEKDISIDWKEPDIDVIKEIYLKSADDVFERSLKLYPLP